VGHTLVWHSQTPFWVFRGTSPPPGGTDAASSAPAATPGDAGTNASRGGGFGPGFGGGFARFTDSGPRASRDELLQRMRDHIHTVVGRYKGRIKAWDVVNEALAEMATLGLPIHVTELDINSAQSGQRATGADIANNAAATQGGLVDEADRRLTEAYEGIFRAFVKHKASVEVVTFWGPNDANSWRRNGRPLLFDVNSQPKPAFHAVIAEAKKSHAAK